MIENWNEKIVEELDILREAGMIEVVGINDEGEWLYGLTPKTASLIDNSPDSHDPYHDIMILLKEIENINRDTE